VKIFQPQTLTRTSEQRFKAAVTDGDGTVSAEEFQTLAGRRWPDCCVEFAGELTERCTACNWSSCDWPTMTKRSGLMASCSTPGDRGRKRSPICRRSTNDKLLTGAELLQRLGIKSNAADREYFLIEVGRA